MLEDKLRKEGDILAGMELKNTTPVEENQLIANTKLKSLEPGTKEYEAALKAVDVLSKTLLADAESYWKITEGTERLELDKQRLELDKQKAELERLKFEYQKYQDEQERKRHSKEYWTKVGADAGKMLTTLALTFGITSLEYGGKLILPRSIAGQMIRDATKIDFRNK